MDDYEYCRHGFVYYIDARVAPGDTRIKIGWSYEPAERLKLLQVGSPLRLNLGTFEPGDRLLEAARHRQFADARVAGEWFRMTPELAAHCREVYRRGVAADIARGYRAPASGGGR